MSTKLYTLLLLGLGMILCASSPFDKKNHYIEKPPYRSLFLENYTEENLKHYLDSAPIDDWEGIWISTEDGTRCAIERFSDPHFSEIFTHRIVLLESASENGVPAGTVMGYLSIGVKPYTCFIWLYKYKVGATLMRPRRFPARLTTDLNGIYFTDSRGKSFGEFYDPRSGYVRLYPKNANDTENREIRYL